MFFPTFKDLLKDVKCEELVCYGLGLFGTCYIARHQLALLIHLASAMQVRFNVRMSIMY